MKLNLDNNNIILKIAYHEYVQNCLKQEIIEIPTIFEEWVKNITKKDVKEYVKKYIKKE